MEIKINGNIGNMTSIETVNGDFKNENSAYLNDKQNLISDIEKVITSDAFEDKSLLENLKESVESNKDEHVFKSLLKYAAQKLYDASIKVGADFLAAYLKAQIGG